MENTSAPQQAERRTDISAVLVARICHEVNRAYCAFIGDESQLPWDAAAEWQRESAIHGVLALLDDPTMTPTQLHESWMAEKLAAGWTYGPTKNPDTRQHPCLVPYPLLPAEQRLKDHLFGAVVRATL